MIVIEGADGVGKTTLARELCHRLHLGYEHYGMLPEGWRYFEDYMPSIRRDVVLDRFIMSELVYGTRLRRGCLIGEDEFRGLEALMALQGCLTVVIVAHHSRLPKRDDKFTGEQVWSVNELYSSMYFGTSRLKIKPTIDLAYMLHPGTGYVTENEQMVRHIVDTWKRRQSWIERNRSYLPSWSSPASSPSSPPASARPTEQSSSHPTSPAC
jgi:hypothetical protein